MYEGKELPPGCVLDAEGHPTRNPRDFYGPPMGTILPFGGEAGYKGFGLSLLTMILGEAMAGEDITDEYHYTNGLALLAVDPAAFGDLSEFKQRMDAMVRYTKETPPAPGFEEVILPGELDLRTRQKRLKKGIPLPDETWQKIQQVAARLHVSLDVEG